MQPRRNREQKHLALRTRSMFAGCRSSLRYYKMASSKNMSFGVMKARHFDQSSSTYPEHWFLRSHIELGMRTCSFLPYRGKA